MKVLPIVLGDMAIAPGFLRAKLAAVFPSGSEDIGQYDFEVKRLVNSILQRKAQYSVPVKQTALKFPSQELVIYEETRQVTLRGFEVDLTPREFAIFLTLAKGCPFPVAYEEIAKQVWGEDKPLIRERIKWLIYLLRVKLERDPQQPELILNKARFGYQLNAEQKLVENAEAE